MYYRSFAVGLCLGPAVAIHKIWANTELIYDLATNTSAYDNVRYLGTETQIADSIMESFGSFGIIPAYRGLVYVVFDDMLISNFNNSIPSLNFEVEI